MCEKIAIGVLSENVLEKTMNKDLRGKYQDDFTCPKDDMVIVGRKHEGDENGKTVYRYGKLEIIDQKYVDQGYQLVLGELVSSDSIKESNSDYQCPESCVLVGRNHDDDENGLTSYQYRKVTIIKKTEENKKYSFNYETTTINGVKESAGIWVFKKSISVDGKEYYEVMVGRKHIGDENKDTDTTFTNLWKLAELTETD